MTPLVFHPIYSQLSLRGNHRFPVYKYQGIRTALADLGVIDSVFHLPEAVDIEGLKRVYDPLYIEQLTNNGLDQKAMRRIGFPWSEQLIYPSNLKMQVQSLGRDSGQGTTCREWHPLFKCCNAALTFYLSSLRAGFKSPTTALFVWDIEILCRHTNALYLTI